MRSATVSSDSAHVISGLCQAIRGLCRNDDNRRRFAEVGLCEVIAELLDAARSNFDVEVVVAACEAIRNLCYGSMPNKVALANAGICVCKSHSYH